MSIRHGKITRRVAGNLRYLLVSMAFFFCQGEAVAQTSSYGALQAAYLFNFAKYITWPQESEEFIIGIYGESEILDELQSILGEKKAGGRVIVIRVITSVDQVDGCRIVYLPGSNTKNLSVLKEAIGHKSILVVTEEDLIRRGASISFVVEDDRLRFKLKTKSLSDAGLKASNGLLKLAIQF